MWGRKVLHIFWLWREIPVHRYMYITDNFHSISLLLDGITSPCCLLIYSHHVIISAFQFNSEKGYENHLQEGYKYSKLVHVFTDLDGKCIHASCRCVDRWVLETTLRSKDQSLNPSGPNVSMASQDYGSLPEMKCCESWMKGWQKWWSDFAETVVIVIYHTSTVARCSLLLCAICLHHIPASEQ